MAKSGNPHGISGYKRNGCRCDICEAAYVKYNADRRKYPEIAPRIDPEPLIEFIVGHDAKLPGGLSQQFARWRENGVDVFVADRHCVKRGVHPFEVYGDVWWDIPAVVA